MFKYIVLLIVTIVINGCLFGGDASGPSGVFPEVHADISSGEYNGGTFKVWVTLSGVVASDEVLESSFKYDSLTALLDESLTAAEKVRLEQEQLDAFEELGNNVAKTVGWNTGVGMLAYHNPVIERGMITSDTAYILWESLPEATIDSSLVGGEYVKTTQYLDTVNVRIGSVQSQDIIVSIKNIVPRIDSVMVNGLTKPVLSENYHHPITLFGVAGQDLYFSLYVSDGYKTGSQFNPVFDWLLKNDAISYVSVSDDGMVYTFKWGAPSNETDEIVKLRLHDSRGEREYRVHIISYKEVGTVWVGDENDLVKFTNNGTEIFRLENEFNEVKDIAIKVDPPSYIWATDKSNGALYGYDNNGMKIFADTSYESPRALAYDQIFNELWITSGTTGNGTIQRLEVRDTLLNEKISITGLSGYIPGITIDYANHTVWYTNPSTDLVYMANEGGVVTDPASFQSFFVYNKPVSISFDRDSNQLWVATAKALYLMEPDGSGIDSIVGFDEISKISAANGICWIVDTKADQVVKLSNGDMSSIHTANNLDEGVNVFSGFSRPLSIVIDESDNGSWVTDTEVGSVVKLDGNGVEVVRIRGLNRPSVIAINQ